MTYPSGKPKPFFGHPVLPPNEFVQGLIFAYGEYMQVHKVPCGECNGCRIKRANEWKNRIMHEARYFQRKSFITLTYDAEHLPPNRTLVVKHFQDFMKRLRMKLYRGVPNERGLELRAMDSNAIGPRLENGSFRSDPTGIEYIQGIKYFACGEYGEAKGRPHYHAVLLGWDWPDKHSIPNNPWAQDALYGSPLLAELWGQGNVTIGDVTPKSAAYVAAYTMKKVYKHADAEYKDTGRIPPFNLMSKGIGARFFEDFRTDIYPADQIVSEHDSSTQQVPRYYDKQLEKADAKFIGPVQNETGRPNNLQQIKDRRKDRALEPHRAKNNTPERLLVREECLKLKLAAHKLRRNTFQNDTKKHTK